MANNITSANSVLMIGVNSLFVVPQQLQGFAQDDAYDVDPVDNAEVLVGVDGIVSSGYVPQIKMMNVMIQADSPSIDFFEAWYAAEEAAKEKLQAFGVLNQPSISRTYALVKGTLRNYSPVAGAKKVLQPRKFQIAWQSMIGAPL